MSDEREPIDLLRDDLDLEAQRFEHAAARLAPAQASDAHGVVEVRLDRDGALEWVRVDQQWRRFYTGSAISSAVIEAYTSAAGERTRVWAEAGVDETSPAPTVRPAPRSVAMTDALSESLHARADAVDPTVLQALGDLLDDLERGFDQAMTDVEDQVVSPASGHSTSGHVTARVVGDGQLVGLEMDERWLETAHSFNIGRETTDAVSDARRRLGERAAASMRDSGLSRLQGLADDPAAMVRYLGLGPT